MVARSPYGHSTQSLTPQKRLRHLIASSDQEADLLTSRNAGPADLATFGPGTDAESVVREYLSYVSRSVTERSGNGGEGPQLRGSRRRGGRGAGPGDRGAGPGYDGHARGEDDVGARAP